MEYIAYIVTLFSVIGTLANSYRKRWCFYVWLCTNGFWIIFNLFQQSYAQALLYLFNLVTCVIGLIKWRKEKNN